MKNYLVNETSPYLLQHSENPVNWYPWCSEAFEKAKKEDKPIFLSIGYSTCHWCHVMAHESFEDEKTAHLLNQYFIAIKVDKEERPDIDSVYMSACQAFTGSGGWPTSIFMTPEQKPFFAGTYFPNASGRGIISFSELLLLINEKWRTDRSKLLASAREVIDALNQDTAAGREIDEKLPNLAVSQYKRSFDEEYGGFGNAPKFPAPHNLLFLMEYYEKHGDEKALEMAEFTLRQMYRGGLFDHIGYGFSRYSTDRYFLIPHFEKMLYDNALLITAYCRAYDITGNELYKNIAEKTAAYVLREMTSDEGGFYCAQDADSEGVEGKYYAFEPEEIRKVLGEKTGKAFNQLYDITDGGNFEGKSIPNLLKSSEWENTFAGGLQQLYEYRKGRHPLHLDDKILTSWNSMMIAALSQLYRISGDDRYLVTARKAQHFIERKLCEQETLFVSWRAGKRGGIGFLDDYAYYIYALISLYEADFDRQYLEKAEQFYRKSKETFYDDVNGGFYLYGRENEPLIVRPKETYDGAVPSGNSMMAYNIVKLYYLNQENEVWEAAEKQLAFLSEHAEHYPTGYSFFLTALSIFADPGEKITVVLKDKADLKELRGKISLSTLVIIKEQPTPEYRLLNDRTTFYVCRNHSCLPPVNQL